MFENCIKITTKAGDIKFINADYIVSIEAAVESGTHLIMSNGDHIFCEADMVDWDDKLRFETITRNRKG